MKKGVLLFFFGLLVGFVGHAWFAPTALIEYNPLLKKAPSASSISTDNGVDSSRFFNPVVFQNATFTPPVLRMRKGNYILITNMDEKNGMWLVSEEPVLNTQREYGFREQIRTPLNTEGSYTAYLKNNPQIRLLIEVTP